MEGSKLSIVFIALLTSVFCQAPLFSLYCNWYLFAQETRFQLNFADMEVMLDEDKPVGMGQVMVRSVPLSLPMIAGADDTTRMR